MNKRTIATAVLGLTGSVLLAAAALANDSSAPVTSLQPATVMSPTLTDATIVAIFDAANTVDIETGELAVKKGASQEVRDFGAMLARDHQAVRQQGRDLAARLGVVPTPPSDDASAKAHAAAMKKLQSLQGPAFDHAFLQHEVGFHKSVIDAVTSTLLPAISNAELKDLVVKVAPAFQAHMLAAKSLDEKLGNKSGK
jgi:putative membrane protein